MSSSASTLSNPFQSLLTQPILPPNNSSSGASLLNPPPQFLIFLREFGSRLSAEAGRIVLSGASSGPFKSISPVLAAYTARCIIHGQENHFRELILSGKADLGEEKELFNSVVALLNQSNSPLADLLWLQVNFELLYAQLIQREKVQEIKSKQAKSAQFNAIVTLGTNIQSNAQVYSLYRAIFKTMCDFGQENYDPEGRREKESYNGGDKSAEREIAAALESVFPQSGLNAFNLLDSKEKLAQINELISIVYGIRLFNKEIGKVRPKKSSLATISTKRPHFSHFLSVLTLSSALFY
jgi:hypothetical protein